PQQGPHARHAAGSGFSSRSRVISSERSVQGNPAERLRTLGNGGESMRLMRRVAIASAHCDLPCGVYDPAQARIEAESVKAIMEKYQGNEDPVFRTRALIIKEHRPERVKHPLWVLWTDSFKPPHFEKYPQLHELFNKASKAAGASGGKGEVDPAKGQELLDLIA